MGQQKVDDNKKKNSGFDPINWTGGFEFILAILILILFSIGYFVFKSFF